MRNGILSDLLTTAEVAERLRLTPRRVGQLIDERKLDATKLAGRWVVRASEVERYRRSLEANGA